MSVMIDTELFPANQQYLRVIDMNFEVKSVGLQIIPVHYPPSPPPQKKDTRCVTPSQVSSLLVIVSPVFVENFSLFCCLAHESGVSGMLLS